MFEIEGLRLERAAHRVTLDGIRLSLTPSEFVLLATLMGSPGRVFSRDELLDRLHPNGEAVVDRVVDVHIGKLRQKLARIRANPAFIQTERGVGYRFDESLRGRTPRGPIPDTGPDTCPETVGGADPRAGHVPRGVQSA